FCQKLCIYPEIFDNILNCVSNNPIFQKNSNNCQLPIALQLAVFLNHMGHCGNMTSSSAS
ncbi:hypothetical protein BDR06DRAFT_871427, partial [Suillus hirtellus]